MDYACRSCQHFQVQHLNLRSNVGVCTHPDHVATKLRVLIHGHESPRCYRGMGDDDFLPAPEDRLIDQRFLPAKGRGLRAGHPLPLIPVYQTLTQVVSD